VDRRLAASSAGPRETEMRRALLFLAIATIAFFVTIEIPVGPEANIKADFEPAMQIENAAG
jgi:hypothetical protein